MESINCIIETPKGCGVKYNYDAKLGCIELSKVLPAGLVFPFDFGFIPGTTGQDGDPLDVIVISEVPSFPGCAMKCRIIGGIKAMQWERDNGEMRNDRYIAVPAASVLYKNISEVKQLPAKLLMELQNFFVNYNDQAGKKFKPLEWVKSGTALKQIDAAQQTPQPTNLVQMLLPVSSNDGKRFPDHYFKVVKKQLLKEFGGVTAYIQSPVSGAWKDEDGNEAKDTLLVFEVMAGKIDRSFWDKFKRHLEKRFKQKELVIRHSEIGVL